MIAKILVGMILLVQLVGIGACKTSSDHSSELSSSGSWIDDLQIKSDSVVKRLAVDDEG